MSKLTEYSSKASFMNVSLEIDGKPYSFNLDIQLKIEEEKMVTHLKEQPRSYAFLCMLRNKVKIEIKKKAKDLERKRAARYNQLAETMEKVTDINNKLKSNRLFKEMQDVIDDLDEIKSVLDIAVDSFNQRKDILQTLSANLRKENN